MYPTYKDTKQKRLYEEPKLKPINIQSGKQIMGIGCKLMTGGSAKGAAPCFPGNYCAQAGS